MSEIKPALTRAEWREIWSAPGPDTEWGYAAMDGSHRKMAAYCLWRMGEGGFSRDDIFELDAAISSLEYADGELCYSAEFLRGLRDRIEALLPPREEK